MKNRGLLLVSLVLALFAGLTVVTQFLDRDCASRYGVLSIPQFAHKVRTLSGITNLVDFEMAGNPFDGACRRLDLMLPPEARVYMDEMVGLTNLYRAWQYNYLAYYLFPREVATSLDQPARMTRDGFIGREAQNREEMLAKGFDIEAAVGGNLIKWRPLREGLEIKPPISPDWFPSRGDAVIAFLLPLLTALVGLELGRLLFPILWPQLPMLERLACGLALGMMAVAALTLGMKLCGVRGIGLVLLLLVAGGAWAVWRNGRALGQATGAVCRQVIKDPAAIGVLLVLLLTFAAAGVLGLVELDAVGAWMLKAKIFHLYAGSDIVRWFSEPRLAHGHFDYPTLVPALHATTFDSIGLVNEYVTKFWPAWMLALLLGALASMSRGAKSWLYGPSCFLLALVCLPSTRLYVESEGGTMPMVFFTTLGFLQCALAQSRQEGGRLSLGLVLLFGGAMAKFEGFIGLAAAGLWIVLLPWSRAGLKVAPGRWRLLGFCVAAALPFICLRVQIPALHYESGWAGDALRHPGVVLSSAPSFLLLIVLRWFVDPGLATWNTESGHLHWAGKWEGVSSLYHHPTLGLAWLTLLLTVILWCVHPASRRQIVWLLAVIATMLVAFSLVFASFVTTSSLDRMLEYYTQEIASSRYLFPLLVAWSATMVTLLFRTTPAAPTSGADSRQEAAPCPGARAGDPQS